MQNITPEMLMGIAAILGAFGLPALWQGLRSGRDAPEDKARAALDDNTAAQLAMLEQLKANNGMFAGLGPRFDTLIELTRALERVQRDVYTEIVRQRK